MTWKKGAERMETRETHPENKNAKIQQKKYKIQSTDKSEVTSDDMEKKGRVREARSRTQNSPQQGEAVLKTHNVGFWVGAFFEMGICACF